MTRSVDATLAAALAAGNGLPYVMAYTGKQDGTVYASARPRSYKLTGTTLEFEFDAIDNWGSVNEKFMWLTRGVTLAGTAYTLSTGRFAIHEQHHTRQGVQTVKGALFPKKYYSAAGDDTYQNVITAFCTAYGKTAVFRNAAAAWLAYKFLPAGRSIILNDANYFLNMLRQKYLVFCCDNGTNDVLFYACDDSFGSADVNLDGRQMDYWTGYTSLRNRQYIWRDEAETVHQSGTATDPIHNLGYLESTASAPVNKFASFEVEFRGRPRLDIVDGDKIEAVTLTNAYDFRALVAEEYAAPTTGHKTPRWETIIRSNLIFENTEGGAVPSTIERVSNYTPVNTSNFNTILSANENNVQAALDKLDDHTHGGGSKYTDTMVFHAANNTVGAGLTRYLAPGWTSLNASAYTIAWPVACTLKMFYGTFYGTQPASGTMVCTVMINGGASVLTFTVAAGSGNQKTGDTTHSVAINAGDLVCIRFVNNASGASIGIGNATILCEGSTY